jgi:hypothetical protein
MIASWKPTCNDMHWWYAMWHAKIVWRICWATVGLTGCVFARKHFDSLRLREKPGAQFGRNRWFPLSSWLPQDFKWFHMLECWMHQPTMLPGHERSSATPENLVARYLGRSHLLLEPKNESWAMEFAATEHEFNWNDDNSWSRQIFHDLMVQQTKRWHMDKLWVVNCSWFNFDFDTCMIWYVLDYANQKNCIM